VVLCRHSRHIAVCAIDAMHALDKLNTIDTRLLLIVFQEDGRKFLNSSTFRTSQGVVVALRLAVLLSLKHFTKMFHFLPIGPYALLLILQFRCLSRWNQYSTAADCLCEGKTRFQHCDGLPVEGQAANQSPASPHQESG
jgi:hypothetical protein